MAILPFLRTVMLAFSLALPLISALPCLAQTSAEPVLDIASTPAFANFRQLIDAYMQRKKPKGAQDFCVVAYTYSDQSQAAWVIWKQGNKLILWEPGDDALSHSRRILDLKHDVVDSENDLHGSTYLVTKAWVKQLQADCERAGVKLSLPANKAHPAY